MADQNYRNLNPKSEDTRYKINNNILRMMNQNPALGIGYLIGNALGENYWGRKRAKTSQEAHDNTMNGYNIQRDSNGNITSISVGSAPSSNSEWTARNAALDAYKNSDTGRNMYQGRSFAPSADNIPRTPQQSNTSGVTMNNNGGTRSVDDYWRNMNNASGYNPGNTTLFTNGVRDMGNVIPGGVAGPAIGADANGVYGVPGANPGVIVDTARGIYPGTAGAGSAPSVANFPQKPGNMPTPYTDDQLKQIAGQNFTPEERARMMTADEQARMNALNQAGQAVVATQAAPAAMVKAAIEGAASQQQPANTTKSPTTTETAIVPDATPNVADLRIHGNTGQGGGGQAFGSAPEYVDPAGNLAVINNPYSGYGYGVNEEGLFGGSAVDRYREYLRGLQRDASGNF